MKASEVMIESLKGFEGCRLTAYRDSAGVWTIGYGHTRIAKKGLHITQRKADDLLREDLAGFEKYVNGLGVCRHKGSSMRWWTLRSTSGRAGSEARHC